MSDRSIDDDDISDGGELDVVTVSNEDIEANQRSPSLDKNDGSDSETFRRKYPLPTSTMIKRIHTAKVTSKSNSYLENQWVEHHRAQLSQATEADFDLVLRAADGQRRAHSSVLALASPFLKQLLSDGCGCGREAEKVMVVASLCLQELEAILNILYSGRAVVASSGEKLRVLSGLKMLGINNISSKVMSTRQPPLSREARPAACSAPATLAFQFDLPAPCNTSTPRKKDAKEPARKRIRLATPNLDKGEQDKPSNDSPKQTAHHAPDNDDKAIFKSPLVTPIRPRPSRIQTPLRSSSVLPRSSDQVEVVNRPDRPASAFAPVISSQQRPPTPALPVPSQGGLFDSYLGFSGFPGYPSVSPFVPYYMHGQFPGNYFGQQEMYSGGATGQSSLLSSQFQQGSKFAHCYPQVSEQPPPSQPTSSMYQSHPQYAAGVGANAEYYGASTAAAEGGYAFREQAGEEIGHGREGRLITALEGIKSVEETTRDFDDPNHGVVVTASIASEQQTQDDSGPSGRSGRLNSNQSDARINKNNNAERKFSIKDEFSDIKEITHNELMRSPEADLPSSPPRHIQGIKCKFCRFVGATKYRVRVHTLYSHFYAALSNHFNNSEKTCTICDKDFATRGAFLKHFGIMHEKETRSLSNITQRNVAVRESRVLEAETTKAIDLPVNNVEDNEVESLLNSDKEDEEEGLDVTHDTDASLLSREPTGFQCCGSAMDTTTFLTHCVRHHVRKEFQLSLSKQFKDLSGSCCECEHEFPDIWSYCDHVGVTHRRVVPFIINDNKLLKFKDALKKLLPRNQPDSRPSSVSCPLCGKEEFTGGLMKKHIVDDHFYKQLRDYLEEDFKQGKSCDCKVDITNFRLYIRHFATKHGVINMFCSPSLTQFIHNLDNKKRAVRNTLKEFWDLKESAKGSNGDQIPRNKTGRVFVPGEPTKTLPVKFYGDPRRQPVDENPANSTGDVQVKNEADAFPNKLDKVSRASIYNCKLCPVSRPGYKNFLNHLANSHFRKNLKEEFNIPSITKDSMFKCPRCSKVITTTNYYSHLGSTHEEVKKYYSWKLDKMDTSLIKEEIASVRDEEEQ